MIVDIYRKESFIELPGEWDLLADTYFQKTGFLSCLEKHNPCNQRYYLAYENNKLVSGAIVYTLNLDLLTYLRIRSPVKMHITGVPCSVSSPGITGDPRYIQELIDYISSHERGLVLFLNINASWIDSTYPAGHTLPTVEIRNQFSSWEEYLAALRSDYRRRLTKITKQAQLCSLVRMDFEDFSDEMYGQYLEVLNRSKGKLEKLTLEFFRSLEKPFILKAAIHNNGLLGWTISLKDNSSFYYFLGGIDYARNKQHNTYFWLLSDIVKQGIESGAKRIDLGQTAEVPKMRLGGNLVSRYMMASHSVALVNKILKIFENTLQYKRPLPVANALKRSHEDTISTT